MGIIHSVIFSLTHEKGSSEEIQFLEEGKLKLSSIPCVNKFQVFRQVSQKTNMILVFLWYLKLNWIMKLTMSTPFILIL